MLVTLCNVFFFFHSVRQVLQNDLLSHQVSVDSVNKAGKDFLATADNPELAKVIEGKLDTVNHKWEDLVKKSEERQQELEKCLGEVTIASCCSARRWRGGGCFGGRGIHLVLH